MTARKNGCFDRKPFNKKMVVRDGYWLDGVEFRVKAVSIKITANMLCQYTNSVLGQTDAGCTGCVHKESK